MSEPERTPESWPVEYDNCDYGGGQWYTVGPARVWFPYSATPEERAEAGRAAALISAAPLLLASLRDLYALADADFGVGVRNGYWPDVAPLLAAAKSALFKAEETPR